MSLLPPLHPPSHSGDACPRPPPCCGQVYIYSLGFCEVGTRGSDLFQSHHSHPEITTSKNLQFDCSPSPANMGLPPPPPLDFQGPNQPDRNRNCMSVYQVSPIWWADEMEQNICVHFPTSNTEENLCPTWSSTAPVRGREETGWVSGHPGSQPGPAQPEHPRGHWKDFLDQPYPATPGAGADLTAKP